MPRVRILSLVLVCCSVFASACADDDPGAERDPIDEPSYLSDAGALPSRVTADSGVPTHFAVGGRVFGLTGSGLTLRLNRFETLAVTRNGSFKFDRKLAWRVGYEVTVASAPHAPSQTCRVAKGSGTVGLGDVDTIIVNCENEAFKVGGKVVGLQGSGLVLENNHADTLTLAKDGTFSFPTGIESGRSFNVTIKQQPKSPVQNCTVAGAMGDVGGADVTSVLVNCESDRYTIGGSISGLSSSVQLQNNGSDAVTVTANGDFAFPGTLASGDSYTVSVRSQPQAPKQVCTVTADSGKVSADHVTSVRVVCTTQRYDVAGRVSGLLGGGLVLRNNAGDNLTVAADGSFQFTTPVASGAVYAVTVLTQPSAPSQTCAVTRGTGTISSEDVSDVSVICVTNKYRLSGTVTGLKGVGLTLETNAGEQLAVSLNGGFEFPTAQASGFEYYIRVLTQPTGPVQTCAVSAGAGVVGGSDVSNVIVNCADDLRVVGGNVSGLCGCGGKLVLKLSTGEQIDVTHNGDFAFPPIAAGTTYNVTVESNPGHPLVGSEKAQTCTVSNSSGTLGAVDVSSVRVVCETDSYRVGGTLSGLASGASVVLQNRHGDDLTLTQNGGFGFDTLLGSQTDYQVSVLSQPTQPSQTCVVEADSGTVRDAAIAGVNVVCTTNKLSVGGTVADLQGTSGLIVTDQDGNELTLTANGSFVLPVPVASGAPYSLAVTRQPSSPSQTCTITQASGTIAADAITDVVIRCSVNSFPIQATIFGLKGSGLTLQNNSDPVSAPVSADTTNLEVAAAVASGQAYRVTIADQPTTPAQQCAVAAGTGTVGGGAANVIINCSTSSFTVGGSISGLAGTVHLSHGSDDLEIIGPALGEQAFVFPTAVRSGGDYEVRVSAQPTSPAQECTVNSGKSAVGNGPVNDVKVECVTKRFTIGGTVSGLAAQQSLSLRLDNAEPALPVDGAFRFATTIPSGEPYAVSIATQPDAPIAQTCTLSRALGTVAAEDVTDVAVSCTTNQYTVGGAIDGVDADGLVLQNNGGADITVSAPYTSFTFPVVASGGTYDVTVKQLPSNAASCSVTNGSGTVANVTVATVVVSCL